jgi:hypothetical protein
LTADERRDSVFSESQEPYEPRSEPADRPEDQPYEPTIPAEEDQDEAGEGGLTYRNADEEAEYDESGDQG